MLSCINQTEVPVQYPDDLDPMRRGLWACNPNITGTRAWLAYGNPQNGTAAVCILDRTVDDDVGLNRLLRLDIDLF